MDSASVLLPAAINLGYSKSVNDTFLRKHIPHKRKKSRSSASFHDAKTTCLGKLGFSILPFDFRVRGASNIYRLYDVFNAASNFC